MKIELSEHFTYGKLLRFSAPSIFMMIFTSIYWIVDGLFIANFAGVTSFAAINLVWPFVMIFSSVGFMLGTGGSALIAKTMGEGKILRANQLFSMLVLVTAFVGLLASVTSTLLFRPTLQFLGINGNLLSECLSYGKILMPAIALSMLQVIFQPLFVAAERPKFSFFLTFTVGMTNIVLDALLIIYFKMGVSGAATATALSWGIGTLVPVVYFALPNGTKFKFCKTYFDGRAMLKICTNGMSEFMSVVSQSVVSALYNYQMLKFAGEIGISAYGIIAYVSFIFIAVFLGYSLGVAPIMSYHFGAENKNELKNLFHKNLMIIAVASVILTIGAEIFALPLTMIFMSDNLVLLDMTVTGFRIFAISFLFSGFSIYASSMFTALNNGIVSATISCCRTLLFECACVMIMPLLFGIIGIWTAIIVAEIMALLLSIVFFAKLRPRYGY